MSSGRCRGQYRRLSDDTWRAQWRWICSPGIPVTSYAVALPWYERFFGGAPSFLPNDTEAVREAAEHRYVYIVQDPARAGHALVLLFTGDLDDRVAAIARQGIRAARREAYDSGATKVTYQDADGNEISLGGSPADATRAHAE